MLVRAEILPGDNWRTLEGSVIPHKVEIAEEERTVVEITRLL